jgi:hypothetical protein
MQAAKRKKMSPHKSQGRGVRRKEGDNDVDDDDIHMTMEDRKKVNFL